MENKETPPNSPNTGRIRNENKVTVLTSTDKKKIEYKLPRSVIQKDPTPQEIQAFQNVCELIAKGYTVHNATKELKQINYGKFNRIVATKHPLILETYARACEERELLIFESILEEANDRTNDVIINDKGVLIPNNANVQRSRLIIDTKFRFLSQMNNKKYGSKAAGSGDTTNVTIEQITGMVVK